LISIARKLWQAVSLPLKSQHFAARDIFPPPASFCPRKVFFCPLLFEFLFSSQAPCGGSLEM